MSAVVQCPKCQSKLRIADPVAKKPSAVLVGIVAILLGGGAAAILILSIVVVYLVKHPLVTVVPGSERVVTVTKEQPVKELPQAEPKKAEEGKKEDPPPKKDQPKKEEPKKDEPVLTIEAFEAQRPERARVKVCCTIGAHDPGRFRLNFRYSTGALVERESDLGKMLLKAYGDGKDHWLILELSPGPNTHSYHQLLAFVSETTK